MEEESMMQGIGLISVIMEAKYLLMGNGWWET